MKIAYLGAGTWGSCLATHLARKGHQITQWTTQEELAQHLTETRKHPMLKNGSVHSSIIYTTDLQQALKDADAIIEAVTADGIQPVFEMVKPLYQANTPILITSKGIQQKTDAILPAVVAKIMPPEAKPFIACLSGPSHAEEVIQKKPTTVVCSGFDRKMVDLFSELFTTEYFRVYPNMDIKGVCIGGALKNVIAIACGINDGMDFGCGTKAALITRGIHEVRKMGIALGCMPETFYGLSGLGDLALTGITPYSRNYRFGKLLAQGLTSQEAKKEIGMVVEGEYTSVSAKELSEKTGTAMPISESIYQVIYHNLSPHEAVANLMKRAIKEEHL